MGEDGRVPAGDVPAPAFGGQASQVHPPHLPVPEQSGLAPAPGHVEGLPPPPLGDVEGGFERGRGRQRTGRGGGRMGMHRGDHLIAPPPHLMPGMIHAAERAFLPQAFGAPGMHFRPDMMAPPGAMMVGPPWMGPGGPMWGPPRGPLMQQGPRHDFMPRDKWSATRVIDNDYCQHFVDTGERPQNFLRDSVTVQLLVVPFHVDNDEAFQDNPKMSELLAAKKALVASKLTPAYGLQADLATLPLNVASFGTRFDVVVIDPPWPEYARRNPEGGDVATWAWDKIRDLAIPDIMDNHGFVFLWCGNEEAVEAGRHCFTHWGLHRVEDICWVKTNRELKRRKYLNPTHQRPATTLHHVKEHCLVGRRGDVSRKRDAHFVHSNVDVDIILSEEPELGSLRKPDELYDIIERFCLGRRRLELFGEDHNMRDGWVTVGIDISVSNFSKEVYAAQFLKPDGQPYVLTQGKIPKDAPHLLGTTDLIESLRPRSP